MPGVAILRILARSKDARRTDKADYLSRRRPYVYRTQAPSRPIGADRRVVRQISRPKSLRKSGRQEYSHINVLLSAVLGTFFTGHFPSRIKMPAMIARR